MKLLMLKGLPASGKSTYARKLTQSGYVRVNKDDLRQMLNDGKWSSINEKRILHFRDRIIERSLDDGCSVVIDDTNFAPQHESRLKELAKLYNATFETKFFDTPVEECIRRDNKRANGVGKDVIMKMYNEYLKPAPAVYTPPDDKPEAIIVDIDGTLAHMNGRSPYSKSGEELMTDAVDEVVKEIVNRYSYGAPKSSPHHIIIVSGREETDEIHGATVKWLYQNGIYHNGLFMRSEGDHRNDAIVKREIFEKYIRNEYNVKFVLDDRNRVVDMWRSLGLKCLQVAEGNF